jgi:hypothetical protein
VKKQITGQELIQCLKESCKKSGKLFIPDSPRQEAVADALTEHYDGDLLMDTVEYFVKSKSGPFLMFDFAIESKKFTEKVKTEKESKEKFRQIVRETHERMVNE